MALPTTPRDPDFTALPTAPHAKTLASTSSTSSTSFPVSSSSASTFLSPLSFSSRPSFTSTRPTLSSSARHSPSSSVSSGASSSVSTTSSALSRHTHSASLPAIVSASCTCPSACDKHATHHDSNSSKATKTSRRLSLRALSTTLGSRGPAIAPTLPNPTSATTSTTTQTQHGRAPAIYIPPTDPSLKFPRPLSQAEPVKSPEDQSTRHAVRDRKPTSSTSSTLQRSRSLSSGRPERKSVSNDLWANKSFLSRVSCALDLTFSGAAPPSSSQPGVSIHPVQQGRSSSKSGSVSRRTSSDSSRPFARVTPITEPKLLNIAETLPASEKILPEPPHSETTELLSEPPNPHDREPRLPVLTNDYSQQVDLELFTVQEEAEVEDYSNSDDMNIARSLTKRLQQRVNNRSESPAFERAPERQRLQISQPQLVSTTNQFIHIARTLPRDLAERDAMAMQATQAFLDGRSTTPSTPGTPNSDLPMLTDTSSRSSSESSPAEPSWDSEAARAQYFDNSLPILSPAKYEPSVRVVEVAETAAAPAIPKRAPTHSKREHERLAHVRSVHRISSATMGPDADSLNLGLGLGQLDEAAEDAAAAASPVRAKRESGIFASGNYQRLNHSVYMLDIQDLERHLFDD